MWSIRVWAGCVAIALTACAHDDQGERERAAGNKLAHQGRTGVTACIACHGASGEGNPAAGIPRLAGLNAGYIAKQLADYARDMPPGGVVIAPIARDYQKTPRVNDDLTVFSPGLRHDPIMSPLAKALTPVEIAQLAAYFASLPFTATPVAAPFQTLERGADLALRGKPEYQLPACVSCHAPDGEGFGRTFRRWRVSPLLTSSRSSIAGKPTSATTTRSA
jgi:Cytochrome c553